MILNVIIVLMDYKLWKLLKIKKDNHVIVEIVSIYCIL